MKNWERFAMTITIAALFAAGVYFDEAVFYLFAFAGAGKFAVAEFDKYKEKKHDNCNAKV